MLHNSNTIYRQTLFHAALFSWNHKRLWFFGIFAGLLNAGGIIEVLLRGANNLSIEEFSWATILDTIFPGLSTFLVLPVMVEANQYSTGTILLIALILSLLSATIITLALTSQGALLVATVKKVGQLTSASAAKPIPSFQTLVREGTKHFWSLFTVNVITKLALILVTFLTFFPMLLFLQSSVAFLSFFSFILLTLLVSLLGVLALAAVALKAAKPIQAVTLAVRMFASGWVVFLESACILFVLAVLMNLALLLVFKLMVVPISFTIVTSAFLASEGLAIFFQFVFMAIMIALLLTVFGFLVTFQYSTWSLLFAELQGGASGRSAVTRYLVHPLRRALKK